MTEKFLKGWFHHCVVLALGTFVYLVSTLGGENARLVYVLSLVGLGGAMSIIDIIFDERNQSPAKDEA